MQIHSMVNLLLMKTILRLIQEHQSINSVDELTHLLSQLSTLLESECFLLGISLSPLLRDSRTLIIDNYPHEWRKQYDQSGFMHIDPIVQYSAKNALPLSWERIAPNGGAIFEEARCNGLHAGFSIPIHGRQGEFGMLSFATSNPGAFKANIDNLTITQLVVPIIIHNLKNIIKSHHTEYVNVQLTQREVEVISWVAEGKSTWEIATILSCSERTIKFHISNLCRKLGAINRCQAISKAIVGGHIHPDC